MATFQPLPAGAIRGDYRDLYPILDKDNLPIGFSSSKGDTFSVGGGGPTKKLPLANPGFRKSLLDIGLLVAPLWATGATYAQGDRVRTSTGFLIEACRGGVSGATEPVFNTDALRNSYVQDNATAIYWRFIRMARTASADNAPLSVTVSTSVPGGLSEVLWSGNPTKYTFPIGPAVGVTGGFKTATFKVSAVVQDSVGSGGLGGSMNIFECVTDAPVFAVPFFNGQGYRTRIYVDGEMVEDGGRVNPTGTPGCKVVTYATRQLRKVRVETENGSVLRGLAVDAMSVVLPTMEKERTCVVMSDSFGISNGSYVSPPASEYMHVLLGKAIGCQNVIGACYGGTGYMVKAPSGNYYNALEVAQNNDWSAYNPTDIIVHHGINDQSTAWWGGSYPYVGAGVYPFTAGTGNMHLYTIPTWQTLRAKYPNARITVVGIESARSLPATGNILDWATQMRADFDAWGDSNSIYVEPIYGPGGSWVTGGNGSTSGCMNTAGGTGNTKGLGNCDYYVAEDGTHSSFQGVLHLTKMISSTYYAKTNKAIVVEE